MRIINQIVDTLLPPLCLVCQKPSDTPGRCLCSDCETFLPENLAACTHCGLTLEPTQLIVCGHCLKHPPIFDASWSAWRYEAPVDTLLKGIKYHRQLAAAKLLGELMADRITVSHQILPDALLPVPLHRNRLWKRGFNQAVELFRPVSRRLDIPMLLFDVQRVRATPSQVGMDVRHRKKNLRDAFRVRSELPDHIAIVDDVVTTGTTVSELTRVLKQSGVKEVQVWSAARAEAP
jgi:ComF family protein